MRTIIIGDGVAGQTVAENLRKADAKMEIVIITQESFPFYTRVYLPHYIANQKTKEELILRKVEWYQQNNVSLILDSKVFKIDPALHAIQIEDDADPFQYDKLVLATGSSARKLPFNNPNVNGMFTLRTIEDADTIKQTIQTKNLKRAFIIGGGLLGIELGYNLREAGLEVTICEILPYLLPRQLDEATAALLTRYLESKKIKVICGTPVKKVIGDKFVTGVEMESGQIYQTDLVFQQMGIIPNVQLAKDAGLKVDKGIIVNEFMQTSAPDIYAAGDCVQFNANIWGIIPASLDQAKIAANAVLGKSQSPYIGTIWNTKLKVAGIKLACFGSPPTKGSTTEKILEAADLSNFQCKKVILDKEQIKGAILLGSGDDAYFQKIIGKTVNPDELQKKLQEK